MPDADLKITSFFTGQTWEGRVELSGETPEQQLEDAWRVFNRVEAGDHERLEEVGFVQPSMSMGDEIVLNGTTYIVATVGFVDKDKAQQGHLEGWLKQVKEHADSDEPTDAERATRNQTDYLPDE